MRDWRIAALCALAAASLAGCGGGGGSTAPAETGSVAEAPQDEEAVLGRWVEFNEAYSSGDGEAACAIADESAQRHIVDEANFYEEVTTCEQAVPVLADRLDPEQAATDWEAKAQKQQVKFEGARAAVYSGDAIDYRPMVYLDGEWLVSGVGPLPPPIVEGGGNG
jgi:hypothetical protein